MIPRISDNRLMVKMISDAIKEVYASVYYKSSKAYMTATANVIDEEKMGIVTPVKIIIPIDHKQPTGISG